MLIPPSKDGHLQAVATHGNGLDTEKKSFENLSVSWEVPWVGTFWENQIGRDIMENRIPAPTPHSINRANLW